MPPNAATDNPPNSASVDEADKGSPSLLSLPASVDGSNSNSLVGDEPAAIDSTIVGNAPSALPPFPDTPQLERTCGDLINKIRTDIGASFSLPPFTQNTLLALFTTVLRELVATQQRMFSKLQLQTTATQQRMFSKSRQHSYPLW
jgi:hypothetical protein